MQQCWEGGIDRSRARWQIRSFLPLTVWMRKVRVQQDVFSYILNRKEGKNIRNHEDMPVQMKSMEKQ
jgi:hypothetical protein